MTNRYLLDTNSIIYLLGSGGKLPKAYYMISVITELELFSFTDLTFEEEKLLKNALKHFENITITESIKNKTIEIRKRYNLKLPDSIIVATAIANKATLVTSDKRLLKLDCLKVIELKDL